MLLHGRSKLPMRSKLYPLYPIIAAMFHFSNLELKSNYIPVDSSDNMAAPWKSTILESLKKRGGQNRRIHELVANCECVPIYRGHLARSYLICEDNYLYNYPPALASR